MINDCSQQSRAEVKIKDRDQRCTCEIELSSGAHGVVPKRGQRLLIQSVEPVVLDVENGQSGQRGQPGGILDPDDQIILQLQVSQMNQPVKRHGVDLLDLVVAEVQTPQLGHATEDAIADDGYRVVSKIQLMETHQSFQRLRSEDADVIVGQVQVLQLAEILEDAVF